MLNGGLFFTPSPTMKKIAYRAAQETQVQISKLRLDGFLRWNYTVWPRDPRYDIRYHPFPAGDTNFVYPGGDMQPLLTLRYMALRRSMEDYELLAMLRNAGQEQVVEELHRSILTNRQFSQFHDEWNTFLKFEEMSAATYQDYERMRGEIYHAIG